MVVLRAVVKPLGELEFVVAVVSHDSLHLEEIISISRIEFPFRIAFKRVEQILHLCSPHDD
jgi:hypothetical protein